MEKYLPCLEFFEHPIGFKKKRKNKNIAFKKSDTVHLLTVY